MSDRVRVPIDLAVEQAKASAKALRTELEGVDETLGEVESAGKQMARALSAAADDLEADLRRDQEAADALGAALGPELAAKLGASGVDALVSDFKRLGLTADDVKADADALAASVKRLDDVGSANVRQVDNRMRELGETTDNTRSVAANFTGNMASELPGVAGAMGPVNMAVGQFAEYATEGNIKLKSLITTGAGMAVVALAVQGVAGRLAEVAATRAFHRQQVDDYVESIREGEDAAEGLARRLEEAGAVKFRLLDSDADITGNLAKAGVTIEQFTTAATGGEVKLGEFEAALRAAGVEGDELGLIMLAAHSYADDYGKAQDRAAAFTKVFGEEADDASEAAKRHGEAQRIAAERLDVVTRRAEDAETAHRNLRDELLRDAAAALDYDRSLLELDGQYAALQEQVMANIATQASAETSDRDKAASARELQLAEYALAEQVFATAGKFAEEQGAVAGSEEAVRLQREELERARAKFPELRDEIDRYIAALDRIPSTVTTRITPVLGQIVRYARGTDNHPGGPAIVGEEGPELVDLPPGSSVTPAAETARQLGGGGGGTTNVYNYFPAALDPAAVVRAAELYDRRNGTGG